jgi:hypothetical protein
MGIVSPVIEAGSAERKEYDHARHIHWLANAAQRSRRSITSERKSGLARELSVLGVRFIGATAFTVMLYFPPLNSKEYEPRASRH